MTREKNNKNKNVTSHVGPAPALQGVSINVLGEATGPLAIVNPSWPLGVFLVIEVLGRDDLNRIYAVGTKGVGNYEHYLVRILPGIALENGSADVDPEFGEGGFVPILSVGDLLVYRGLQIVDVTPSYLTVCCEVVDETNGLFQTALFRFLINGQPDPSFGHGGCALFSELPEPPLPSAIVGATPKLEPWEEDDEQQSLGSQGFKARQRAWHHEAGSAAVESNGKALANGKVLLVAHKRRIIGEKYSCLIKVNEDGTLDSLFADGVGYLRLMFAGSRNDSDYRASIDSRERSIVVSESEDGIYSLAVRIAADGRLDPGFGGGILRISSSAGAMYQPLVRVGGDDKVVISVCYAQYDPGFDKGVYIFKLDESGRPDPAFNNGQPVEFIPRFPDVLYQASNIDVDDQQRVILRGTYRDQLIGVRRLLVSRFTAQGIDGSFGEGGSFSLFGLAEYSGGLVAQSMLAVVVSDHTYLWKLTD